jgi:hypothetical protein
MQPEMPVTPEIVDPYEGMAEVPCYGVIAVEGIETGDLPRREFAPDSLDWAAPPLSFKWQEYEEEAHEGACVVGRMDAIWRDGALLRFVGALDNVGDKGRELIRLRRGNFVRGVSIKADDLEAEDIELVYPAPVSEVVELAADGPIGDDEDPAAPPLDAEEIEPLPGDEGYAADGEDFHYPGRHNQAEHGYGKNGKGKASNRQKAAAGKRIKARGDKFLSGDRSADGAVTADGMDGDMPMMMAPVKIITHHARIRSATVVAEAAFVEATFELGESPFPVPLVTVEDVQVEIEGGDEPVLDVAVADGSNADEGDAQDCGTIDRGWRGGPTTITATAYTITIPEVWPETWFEEPSVDELPAFGAINITAAGRIYGLLGPSQVAHRAFRGTGRAVKIPQGIDYSEFHNKGCLVAAADGQVYKINAGNVTFDCGHASPHDPRRADPAWAAQHYDNACSIAARVRVGENRYGTWVAGGLIHGLTPNAVERMMGCALSGDWQGGKLKGALLVPVEGFPVPVTASVRVREDALVASSVPLRLEADAVVEPQDFGWVFDLVASATGRGPDAEFAEMTAARFDEIVNGRG